MRRCTKCKIEKDENCFYRIKNTNYFQSDCKECRKKSVLEYRKNNPNKVKEYTSKYNKSPKYREYHKKWDKINKDKRTEYRRRWVNKYPEKELNSRLLYQFGITIEKYKQMLKIQNNVCAICGQKSKIKRLCIDHCHKTNIIRGLLCDSCNKGLGDFKDNIKYIKSAIKYLQKYDNR